MNIKKFAKQIYWNLLYYFRYIILFHKFGHVGKETIIHRPLRIRGGKRIYVGNKCFIMDGLRIEAVGSWRDILYNSRINIGDAVQIQQNCHITCAKNIDIGYGCSILPGVLITDIEHEHVPNKVLSETHLIVGEVIIGKFVCIGMGARIIGKTKLVIGDNAVIGANTVVTKDVPEAAIVAGVPAKIIGWNIVKNNEL